MHPKIQYQAAQGLGPLQRWFQMRVNAHCCAYCMVIAAEVTKQDNKQLSHLICFGEAKRLADPQEALGI